MPIADFDPEDLASDYSSPSDVELTLEKSEDLSRSHYVPVEKSKLRHDDLVLGEKYSGKSISRRDIFSSSEDELSVTEYQDLDEDIVSDKHAEEEEEEQGVYDEITRLAKENIKLINTAKKTASADIKKGKHVRNQIALFESLLDTRIRAQKCLNVINEGQITASSDHVLEKLTSYIETLFDLKCSLLCEPSPSVDRNNIINNPSERIQELMLKSTEIDKKYESKRNEAINHWNQRVQLSSITNKNLKALNISIPDQVTRMMSSDRERLVTRTQQNRTKGEKTADPEIFDDNDYYSTLLRDFIDSKSVSNPLELSKQWAALKAIHQKKGKDNVDRKASKGRKLRYETHEKLQNFMTPIDRATWHDERVNELFQAIQKVYNQ